MNEERTGKCLEYVLTEFNELHNTRIYVPNLESKLE
jgi:hypothetical protein